MTNSANFNMQVKTADFRQLLAEVRACRMCEAHLPNPPKPVLRAWPTARVLVVGQAPGRRVHESGIPWNDPSGELLREWLGVDCDAFYDERRIAIIPAGLCYRERANRAISRRGPNARRTGTRSCARSCRVYG